MCRIWLCTDTHLPPMLEPKNIFKLHYSKISLLLISFVTSTTSMTSLDLLYCQPSAPEGTEITRCAAIQTSAQLTGDHKAVSNACCSGARGQHGPGLHA